MISSKVNNSQSTENCVDLENLLPLVLKSEKKVYIKNIPLALSICKTFILILYVKSINKQVKFREGVEKFNLIKYRERTLSNKDILQFICGHLEGFLPSIYIILFPSCERGEEIVN